jgi:hypothetical protein
MSKHGFQAGGVLLTTAFYSTLYSGHRNRCQAPSRLRDRTERLAGPGSKIWWRDPRADGLSCQLVVGGLRV